MIRFFLPHVRTKDGYTLVELIVVVTILAILSTISFLAYTNMTSDARNTVRKTDMAEMKVRLRGIAQKSGAFPMPSTPLAVTNSGFLALNQGWTDTIDTSNGSSFNADPKSKRPYRYSTVTSRQSYQIGMSLELGSEAYGSYVDGDYTPLSPYVFPSLLLATDATGTLEIHEGIGSGSLNRTGFIVNNGSLNLPYDMGGLAVNAATTFSGILEEPGVRLPWTSSYATCQDIYEGGKNMGPGDYLIISSTGALTMTGCVMSPPTY
jgi:prepilin-type N-terminal cleavage/methylation domain-containing protein